MLFSHLTHETTYRLTNPVIDASLLKPKKAPGGGEMCPEEEEEEEEEEIPGGSYLIAVGLFQEKVRLSAHYHRYPRMQARVGLLMFILTT